MSSRHSLVVHRDNHFFIKLEEDYWLLFGKDHGTATLVSYLELATNTENEHRLRYGGAGEIWLEESMKSLTRNTLKLFSERSLTKRIQWLESLGII